jgi:flagellar motor protein MotB
MSEDSGEKVPLWYISFADMITLLLSFFVMLQTMAHTQDSKLLGISQESFRRAIAGMGVPDFLFGRGGQLDLEYHKVKNAMEEKSAKEVNPGRIIDADDESIRKLFEQIKKEMETQSTNQTPRLVNVIQAPIAFASGGSELSAADKAVLDGLVRNLIQNGAGSGQLEVLGWAGDEPSEQRQWMVSAQRAGEVERYLRASLGKVRPGQWELSSWGVGPSNPKLQTLGFVPGKSAILIAVTAKGE